jgi:hypothetical protein
MHIDAGIEDTVQDFSIYWRKPEAGKAHNASIRMAR